MRTLLFVLTAFLAIVQSGARADARAIPDMQGATLAPRGTPAQSMVSSEAAIPPRWGVSDEGWPPNNTVLGDLAQALGRPADIVSWYVQAVSNYPPGTLAGPRWQDNEPRVRSVIASGEIPMITWEMWGDGSLTPGSYWSFDDIAAGREDAYIDSWAAGVRDAGGLVYLRPFHEMNLMDVYPWSVRDGNRFHNTPAGLVSAWRHIVDRFRAAGATNARWVFNVGGDITYNPLPAGAYPGDDYVDYIGADSYANEPPDSLAHDEPFIAAIANKPWLMGEVGGPANWVTDELVPFIHRHDVAVVWFNKPPWPLIDDPDLISAVKAMVATMPPGPASAGPGGILTGSLPPDGSIGLVVFGGGTPSDLVSATGCRGELTLWFASGGSFIAYVPGTSVSVVNAPFFDVFPGDIPANTALIGRCRTTQ